MNQHHIQEAYLKNFADKGKLWVFNNMTESYSSKPASQCTIEENFQSDQLEKLQNATIESPGIQKLRKLVSKGNLSDDDIKTILYWTALHTIRNKNFRGNSGLNYQSDFDELLNTEKLFTNYFRYIFIYSCNQNNFFITSDNPIIEFYIGDKILRVLTWSPQKAILFSPIDNYPSHEVEFSEMVNSMLLAGSFAEIYSNNKNLPIKKYKENIEEYNLKPKTENTLFYTKNR